ncbi:MAG: hypothetical protein WAO09_11140 [Candidatus Dormiibacterota bacterium]
MTDARDHSRDSYRASAHDVECLFCHRHFITRAGSRTLLCFTCRARFRSGGIGPAHLDQGGTP